MALGQLLLLKKCPPVIVLTFSAGGTVGDSRQLQVSFSSLFLQNYILSKGGCCWVNVLYTNVWWVILVYLNAQVIPS